MANETAKSSGNYFIGLLAIAFIILKLCKIINWSWWWVLAPFWGTEVLAIIYLVVSLLLKKKEDKQPQEPRKSKWQERLEKVKNERGNKT